MHSMSNLNKFHNSYQILEKKSKTHKECLNNFLGHMILATNTLGTNGCKHGKVCQLVIPIDELK
jgi:hypothetical protein